MRSGVTLDVLLLRFEAPLMSFGGALVDQISPTRDFPGRAMLAGLFGNALGYRHQDAEKLASLQSRIRWAAREDRRGEPFMDYQTVNLAAPHMLQGWTTRDAPEGRDGGDKNATTIRYRHYLADAAYVVAVALDEGAGPALDDLAQALDRPARPLFLGRKCCLPSVPLRYGRVKVGRLRDALTHAEVQPLRRGKTEGALTLRAWWPVEDGTEQGRTVAFTDDMDWANQIHVGRHYVQEGAVMVGIPSSREVAS